MMEINSNEFMSIVTLIRVDDLNPMFPYGTLTSAYVNKIPDGWKNIEEVSDQELREIQDLVLNPERRLKLK